MTTAFFCLDEAHFIGAPSDAKQFIDRLRQVLEFSEYIRLEKDYPLEIYSGIFEFPTNTAGVSFADVVYGQPLLALSRDFSRRLQLLIDRCTKYSSKSASAPNAKLDANGISDVMVGYSAERAVTERRKAGRYCGIVLPLAHKVNGEVTININGLTALSYLVNIANDVVKVFRYLILRNGLNEEQFFAIAKDAFPKLHFHPDLAFRRFSRPYSALREDVVTHLAFLNDQFLQIAEESNWDTGAIVKRASSVGISLSDESKNTKRNAKAMRERLVSFSGNLNISCTLHTKISPTRDRIHFHPPKSDISGDRLIVGIFATHLTI